MAVRTTYTCNICGESFVVEGQSKKPPVGWGVIKPRLTVNYPSYPEKKKDYKAWSAFRNKCDKLKEQLSIQEYHLCHECLQFKQDNVIQIEGRKNRRAKAV